MKEVAVLGATGYTGTELVRLLCRHPQVKIAYLSSEKHAGQCLSGVHPQFKGRVEQVMEPMRVENIPDRVEVVFCALPHGKSFEVVPALLDRQKRVVDLSADFRLKDPSLYDKWYGYSHPAAQLLKEAVYGLTEINAAAIAAAKLVANPGCYPTGTLLALAPLAEHGLIDWSSVVVDAKSGVSGAGRTPRQGFHYPECADNFKAYRLGNHQHTPEIEQELGYLGKEQVTLSFTPHLLPIIRGILTTIYLQMRRDIDEEVIASIYQKYYSKASFVRLFSAPALPETRLVRGSNYCDLGWKLDRRTGRLIIVSAIDNLVKGASGQAVQNMNLMLGYPQETALEQLPC